MEFYRWILIATGVVLLIVAFLMGRNKPTGTIVRRSNTVKPIAENSPGSKLPEPTPDPLHSDDMQDGADPLRHEQAGQLAGQSVGQAAGLKTENPDAYDLQQDLQSNHPQDDFAAESFAISGQDQDTQQRSASGLSSSDDFDEIDIALESDSYQGKSERDASSGVTSFASAVQAANAQDDIVSADMDDFDENFYEEFESYNGPVQLEEFEEKLVTIHVVALSGRRFYGNDLKSLFDKHGYKFGRMSLYHCALEGEKVFSIANIVKPGTFNEDQMSIFETPGITLFMRLPIELDAGVAFDFLLQEATELAQELDGQLRDGNRNPLSQQTIQHMREDIQQYVFRTKRVLQPVT